MESTKSFLCAIGIVGLVLSSVDCASLTSSSVSSPPLVVKKINSVNDVPSSPSPVPSPSVSVSSVGDEQPADGSMNSLNSDYLMGRPSQGEVIINSKPSDPLLGDHLPIRSPLTSNFIKSRGSGHIHSSSTPSPSLTSSFSSSFSPSKLFPSLFSSSSSPSKGSILPSLPVHSFALRPINRLLELWPRNDYSDEANARDNYQPKVYHKRPHHGVKQHHDQHGNSLTAPVFYSNDHYPDLTKQGTISRQSWYTNTFRGQFQPTRRSTFRSIVDRIFG